MHFRWHKNRKRHRWAMNVHESVFRGVWSFYTPWGYVHFWIGH
jgi:hypothetical protein